MKRLIIIPILVVLAGCGTLHPDDMGATAKCLHNAETVRDVNKHMDEYFPDTSLNTTEEVYQSMRNECMWAKAQAKKD